MEIRPFALERYFARHEFTARYLLSCSDCEPLQLAQLLQLADDDTAALWRDLSLAYTESLGHPRLRHAIAELYDGLTADDILVAAPQECIFLFMHALLEPGDHVVCTAPGYQSLYEVARDLGCELSLWQPVEQVDRWYFDLSTLAGLLRSDTRLVVVNFPHNPTGALPSEAEFRQLVELLSRRGVHLFSDEMYRFLELDGRATLPAACEFSRTCSTLGGVSKSFGLPGLRIGWLASRDRALQQRVAELKDYTTICASAPSETLALIGLHNRERIVASHLVNLHRNLGALDQFFSSHRDWFLPRRPQAGSVCFPRVTSRMGSGELCRRLVSEAGIMLAPSEVFDFGDHHLRFGFGREDLPQGLDQLAAALKNLRAT